MTDQCVGVCAFDGDPTQAMHRQTDRGGCIILLAMDVDYYFAPPQATQIFCLS